MWTSRILVNFSNYQYLDLILNRSRISISMYILLYFCRSSLTQFRWMIRIKIKAFVHFFLLALRRSTPSKRLGYKKSVLMNFRICAIYEWAEVMKMGRCEVRKKRVAKGGWRKRGWRNFLKISGGWRKNLKKNGVAVKNWR